MSRGRRICRTGTVLLTPVIVEIGGDSLEFSSYSLEDYPDVNEDDITFPKTINISYAVCSKQCGNAEFIVDGSSQVCQYCGKLMFRFFTKEYDMRG